MGHGRLPKRKGALNERNQRANRAVREEGARSTCALLAAPVCGEDVCATTARGVLGGVCARRKCAQEPAAPVRSGTSGINAAKNAPRNNNRCYYFNQGVLYIYYFNLDLW